MEQCYYGIRQSSNPQLINKRNLGDNRTVHDFAHVYLHSCPEQRDLYALLMFRQNDCDILPK